MNIKCAGCEDEGGTGNDPPPPPVVLRADLLHGWVGGWMDGWMDALAHTNNIFAYKRWNQFLNVPFTCMHSIASTYI